MQRRIPTIATLTLALGLATGACGDDAADETLENDALEQTGDGAAFGDTMLSGDSAFAPGTERGGIAPGTSPDTRPGARPADMGAPGGSATPGATTPGATPNTGPAGSSAREGSGPPGGDDLGRGRDVGSAATPTDAILGRASAAYTAVRTLRASFEQVTENPVLGRTTTSRGTIYQARPDRFLMRFSQPEGDRIVSDGTHIWVYYPSVDERQVIRMRAGAGGAGAVDLQAQFLGDPTRRFDARLMGEESVGGRAADVVLLTPREPGNFRTLKVWVDRRDNLVRRFEITEHNGVIRRFLLRDLTPGADVDDSLFRFTPPEGAHVVARG